MTKITKNRCYPPEERCNECNHGMNRHDRNGCRNSNSSLSSCMCKIKNPTFSSILRNHTRLNYRSDKRGMIVLYG